MTHVFAAGSRQVFFFLCYRARVPAAGELHPVQWDSQEYLSLTADMRGPEPRTGTALFEQANSDELLEWLTA